MFSSTGALKCSPVFVLEVTEILASAQKHVSISTPEFALKDTYDLYIISPHADV